MALEEEWPDSSAIAAERVAQREAATPLPERVWALRNVAATLALGGPGELSRARQLLEKALQLKEESVDGAAEHPGARLATLWSNCCCNLTIVSGCRTNQNYISAHTGCCWTCRRRGIL